MIHVQERTLCAFEQHLFAFIQGTVEIGCRIGKVCGQLSAQRHDLLIYLVQRKFLCLRRKQRSLFLEIVRQRSTKSLRHREVADPKAAPAASVLVGRADSATRGANALHTAAQLIGLLDRTVIVQDQMATVADEQAILATDARGRQKLNLLL